MKSKPQSSFFICSIVMRHCNTLKTVGLVLYLMGDDTELRNLDLADSETHGKFFMASYGWALLSALPGSVAFIFFALLFQEGSEVTANWCSG